MSSSVTNLSSPPSSFPLMDFKEVQQFHFFMNSPQQLPSSSSSSSSSSSNSPSSSSLILFNITQDQRPTIDVHLPQPPHDKVGKCISGHGGSSDHHHQDETSFSSVQQHGKIKISLPSNGSSGIMRTCSDCNTSKTPLWRSGPQGPKSLCNACGIRQRKARRAMAASATNEVVSVAPNNSTIIRAKNKEKKLHKSLKIQFKKPFKVHGAAQVGDHQKISGSGSSSFEDFALRFSKNLSLQRAFPKDEEEAAVLLMALSCGFICS